MDPLQAARPTTYKPIRERGEISARLRFPRRLRRDPAARLYAFGLPGAGVSAELRALSEDLEAAGYSCARVRVGPLTDLSLPELHLAVAEAACATGDDAPFGALLEFCPPPEGDTISLYPLQRVAEWRREMARRPRARRRFAEQVEAMEDCFFERVRAGVEAVDAQLKAEGAAGLALIIDGLARQTRLAPALFGPHRRWDLPAPIIFAPPLSLFPHAPPDQRALLGALPPASRGRLFEILEGPREALFAEGAEAEAARWIGTPGDLLALLEAAVELEDPPFTPDLLREAAEALALALRDQLQEADHLETEGARLTPEVLSRLERGLWQVYITGGRRIFTPHPLLLTP